MKKCIERNKLVIAVGILYTLNALVVVLSAWAVNLNRFRLDITISRYIGFRRWTVFMYMIVAGLMATLAFIHIIRIKMHIIKKALYLVAFSCVFLGSVFPTNRDWNVVSSNIHNVFSYTLMSCVIITIIWMLIKPLGRAQRIFSIVAICYSVFFLVVFFIIKPPYLFNTVLIWENVFVYIFLAELSVEKSSE
ncbi:MAG: hypothetical protein J6X80_02765 [Lachnospiraceae bacterium]|nr:hypothetical protein [Lachnospiraceae bacterium]